MNHFFFLDTENGVEVSRPWLYYALTDINVVFCIDQNLIYMYMTLCRCWWDYNYSYSEKKHGNSSKKFKMELPYDVRMTLLCTQGKWNQSVDETSVYPRSQQHCSQIAKK